MNDATIKEPARIRRLARDSIGRPVPWFVQWFDDDEATEYGVGKPDFRVVDSRKLVKALRERRCFICGDRITGPNETFAIGPMCVVNRISSEPPNHFDCAVHAMQVCPWVTNPNKDRRDLGKPDEVITPEGMVTRNPGVCVLWVTRSHELTMARDTVLVVPGNPTRLEWWCRGRRATGEEIAESFASGLELLIQTAESEGPESLRQLGLRIEDSLPLLPAPIADVGRKALAR